MSKSVRVSLLSYGHVNGPISQQHIHAHYHKTFAYNIRLLPNPPRHLRAHATGLSRRLQKEFLRNDHVEAFLVKVQNELLHAVREGCDQLSPSAEQNERKHGEFDECRTENALFIEGFTSGDPDIDVVGTICCEEGRHRSVAFVEELARRLAMFKHGDGISRHWQLELHITHRDIEDLVDMGQHSIQHKLQDKTQSSSRRRGRHEKRDRYRSCLEDEVEG
ncbi:hypothetical protein N7492_008540 [Penicillium capsulatum]|uniref:Uncharacterized protein n=1 Tax=Penicillium capsulatum TaxID=69766 RepID=A0A9W9HS55_9EURO|nr:hypothetical protein N7492_008540 [Penicillium capsulatum]KAJ6105945.1 hypothetical protein N7512_009462 [Penicillium capsulatum]